MVKSPWSVVWVEVDDAEAERAMATRTFSWARRRAAVEIHHHPPVHGGRWLVVSLQRAGAWEALARMAVPSAFDPARYESKGRSPTRHPLRQRAGRPSAGSPCGAARSINSSRRSCGSKRSDSRPRDRVMFVEFLYELRSAGIPVGLGEWNGLLAALRRGLAATPRELYTIGRALLCRSEADFDRFDVAFARSFRDAELSPELKAKLAEWLAKQVETPKGERVDPGIPDEDLWDTLMERLRQQEGEHNGGNRWVGTGGKSPFGHGGEASRGIRVGGSGGGRSAIQVAMERRWENYRTDRTLNVRDLEVALRELRKLIREGRYELDLDGTIRRTCENAGDIEIVEQRERQNQVHLVLLMDAGGSMAPHAERVSQLFTAADRTQTFKSFTAYSFHNCVYGWLYKDIEQLDRVRTEKVLSNLTPIIACCSWGMRRWHPTSCSACSAGPGATTSWPGSTGSSGSEHGAPRRPGSTPIRVDTGNIRRCGRSVPPSRCSSCR